MMHIVNIIKKQIVVWNGSIIIFYGIFWLKVQTLESLKCKERYLVIIFEFTNTDLNILKFKKKLFIFDIIQSYINSFILSNFLVAVFPNSIWVVAFSRAQLFHNCIVNSAECWCSIERVTMFWSDKFLCSVGAFAWRSWANFKSFNCPLISIVFIYCR